jgi:hypothetical protein
MKRLSFDLLKKGKKEMDKGQFRFWFYLLTQKFRWADQESFG